MLVVTIRIYGFSTYAHSSTPDGLDMAYRKLALKYGICAISSKWDSAIWDLNY